MNAVKKALASVEKVSPQVFGQSEMQLATITEQVEHFAALCESFLSVEQVAKSKVEEKLASLKAEQEKLTGIVTFGKQYPLLSLEPLTWRDKSGLPLLVVFGLDSPSFQLVAYRPSDTDDKFGLEKESIPKLPPILLSLYDDVCKRILRSGELCIYSPDSAPNCTIRGRVAEIGCTFEGVIPSGIKQKITESKDKFQNIFIVAEQRGMKIPPGDPLIVGWDGQNLWLIADFDTTPVEEAMISHLP